MAKTLIVRCGYVGTNYLTGHYSSLRPASTNSQSSSQYVIDTVKKYDYESYLCLLLLPKAWRYPSFVAHAYNVELSLILESAKEPRAAAGRFAFWNDSVEAIFKSQNPHNHPVVLELNAIYHSGIWSQVQARKYIKQLLSARHDISRVSFMNTLKNLEDYAEKTKASLLYLTLGAAQVSDLNADHAASHLGRCQGLVTALRSTPYLTTKNQLLIPQDLLTKHQVSQQDVLKARDSSKEAIYDLASVAHGHLETVKSLLEKVPKHCRSVFIPMTICEQRLELLRKCDFNLFDKKFQAKNSLLSWQLWRASKRL